MINCEISGLFSVKQCENIKKIMQGKTFLNFDIQHGGYGEQNQTIIVSSNAEDCTAEELKSMFFYVCLTELAKRSE